MEEILRELVNELKVHNRLLARTIVDKENGIPSYLFSDGGMRELSQRSNDVIHWAQEHH